MKLLKTILILLVIVAIFGGAMFALNIYTGPIIEENKLGAIKDKLNLAMPDAESYELLELDELPENITAVYKETSGKGFVIICTAKSDYTQADPMEIVLAVDTTGKISGIKLVSHSESLIFGADYPSTYVGADSTLFGVELYAGSTYSSKAFKAAVEKAMGVLIENDLIKAAEKSPEQILTELIATVAPDLANAQKSEGKGDVVTVFKATAGSAYIVKDGEAYYLAVITADGACKLYDVDGLDVTEAKADVVKKATDYAASAANERLNEVLPDAAGFEDITATLTNLPASVVKVHKETNGLGFAIEVSAVGYNKEAPMDVVIGVDAEGKIVEIKIYAYNDTPSFDMREKDPTYLDSFKGKDSALTDVGTVAGATISSSGFRGAVAEAMSVLVENNLIAAGVKTDAQILTEMIPTLHTGLTSGGNLKAEAIEGSGNITEGYKALNGSGYAFIVKNGEASVLALVNAVGTCKVYDTTGADVTAANAAVCTEVLALTEQQDFSEAANKMILVGFADATEITPVTFDTFSNVVYAATFKSGDATYYAFYSCPLTYGDHAMAVCTVIDENGAIAKQDVKEFLFGHGVEYLPIYNQGYGDISSGAFKDYENSFGGLTSDTLTDDVLVSGATLSSTAVKLGTTDAFATFNSVKGGDQ